jgi:histidinol-phosphate phosphatase family protein
MRTLSAAILAGGRGTRSADPGTAKLGQPVWGRSLLDWHIDLIDGSAIRSALVVAGHLGDQVAALVADSAHRYASLHVVQEEKQNGTVAALRLAAEHDDADDFLVILGDTLMSFPVDPFISAWRASGKSVAVIVHPSTHPHDSDKAFVQEDGTVEVLPKSADSTGIPNSSSTGLFALTRGALKEYGSCRDIGSDVLPRAAAEGDLFGYVSSHYFKDTGTPDRLAAANADVSSGAFQRRGSVLPRRALFLDRDGVVNPAKPEIYDAAHYQLTPSVAEEIGRANRAGIPVVVVTNQPGIAKGFMTASDHTAIRARMDDLLAAEGAFVDDYAHCPHHPETGFPGEVTELKIACECRKPLPGMLLRLAEHHGIDLSSSVMIGDTWRDDGAARAAGVGFISVAPEHGVGPCGAIRQAIEVIAC